MYCCFIHTIHLSKGAHPKKCRALTSSQWPGSKELLGPGIFFPLEQHTSQVSNGNLLTEYPSLSKRFVCFVRAGSLDPS